MVFRNIFLSVGLTLLFSIAFTGEKTHAQVPHKFRVYVGVSCDDENTKTLIQSKIKRELRSLGDVFIVGSDDARYILAIVAVELRYETTRRKSGGIALGTMFLKKTPDEDYYYPDLLVHTGDRKNDLERFCKSIVADLDTRWFERVRELFQ